MEESSTTESPKQPDPKVEKLKERDSEKLRKVKEDKSAKKKDEKSLENVLKSINNLTTIDDKFAAICKKYAEISDENRKHHQNAKINEKRMIALQREKDQVHGELSKAVVTRGKLENLCRELQKQNKAMKDESLQRIKEEEEKRKEVSAKFHATLADITALMQQNTESNAKLRDENIEMQTKFKSVCEQYELREQQVEKISKQMKLESQLADARLKKAKLEMLAEKEIMERDKQQLLAELAMCQSKLLDHEKTEEALRAQINVYFEKYDEFQTVLTKSNKVYTGFKGEMEKMSKKITRLEKETSSWKQKWEGSQQSLLQLANEKKNKDTEVLTQGRQLAQLQKLCRTLQTERAALLQQLKNEGITPESQDRSSKELSDFKLKTDEVPPAETKTDSANDELNDSLPQPAALPVVETNESPSINSVESSEKVAMETRNSTVIVMNEKSPDIKNEKQSESSDKTQKDLVESKVLEKTEAISPEVRPKGNNDADKNGTSSKTIAASSDAQTPGVTKVEGSEVKPKGNMKADKNGTSNETIVASSDAQTAGVTKAEGSPEVKPKGNIKADKNGTSSETIAASSDAQTAGVTKAEVSPEVKSKGNINGASSNKIATSSDAQTAGMAKTEGSSETPKETESNAVTESNKKAPIDRDTRLASPKSVENSIKSSDSPAKDISNATPNSTPENVVSQAENETETVTNGKNGEQKPETDSTTNPANPNEVVHTETNHDNTNITNPSATEKTTECETTKTTAVRGIETSVIVTPSQLAPKLADNNAPPVANSAPDSSDKASEKLTKVELDKKTPVIVDSTSSQAVDVAAKISETTATPDTHKSSHEVSVLSEALPPPTTPAPVPPPRQNNPLESTGSDVPGEAVKPVKEKGAKNAAPTQNSGSPSSANSEKKAGASNGGSPPTAEPRKNKEGRRKKK